MSFELVNNLSDLKGVVLLKNKTLFTITKSSVTPSEIDSLITLITDSPDSDIIEKTVSSIKYNKKISKDNATTDYEVNVMTIHTPQELNKYKAQTYHMFTETREMYEQIMLPQIKKIPSSVTQWIDNYGSLKSTPLYTQDDFFLVPDVKWNMKDLTQFYAICFSRDSSILSIRSLRQQHVPFLKKLKTEVLEFIHNTYGLEKDEIVVYCHYHPSFWHFHVHFTNIAFPSLTRNNVIGKAVLLDTIIQNLQICDSYYQNADLQITLGTSSHLYELYSNYVPQTKH
ncbi:scavenger mRNA-decapping enzyme DcpS, putative [Entamoeba invadens IP1]|uniref:Scavenger mRNA-decapping enzyme DcpS, putative n=1 Tax=Entamoeba invadens IP1 TaxID=370355 RepID=A0A0A1UCX7_ENTIV|nr:scavenger mRNA-decapping enzyme DcpS, putative [Entamoeba invadens IP1]ELP90149.1 scavenger mRNA-decapping enzyme DcpS, putative [Entamoeba invadens IP1]|eukprot:XP_004256920.1 scavenger mRNA-decapping enzyme DcpS, putative [Entamoeba invadens IP1]